MKRTRNARANKFVLMNPEVMIVCALKATIRRERNVFPHQSSLAIHLTVGEYIIFSIYCMYIAPAGPLLLTYI